MSKIQRRVMQRFYRQAAGDPTRLPWHVDEPPGFLGAAIRNGRRRALDVGCGSGVFSAWMAQHGVAVTALDYLPDATAMARATATREGVEIEVVQEHLLSFTPPGSFDLVFDSACLHNMNRGDVPRYKQQLLRWLEPDGDFILSHWGKRHVFDWRPIGPRRRTSAVLQTAFAPELELLDAEVQDERVPLPFGPWVRMATYWFRRRSTNTPPTP